MELVINKRCHVFESISLFLGGLTSLSARYAHARHDTEEMGNLIEASASELQGKIQKPMHFA